MELAKKDTKFAILGWNTDPKNGGCKSASCVIQSRTEASLALFHSCLCLYQHIVRRERGEGVEARQCCRSCPYNRTTLSPLSLPPSLQKAKKRRSKAAEQLHGVQKSLHHRNNLLLDLRNGHIHSLFESALLYALLWNRFRSFDSLLHDLWNRHVNDLFQDLWHRHIHNLFHDSIRHLLLRNHLDHPSNLLLNLRHWNRDVQVHQTHLLKQRYTMYL